MHDRYETSGHECVCRKHARCPACLGMLDPLSQGVSPDARKAYWDELAQVRRERAALNRGET